MPCLTLCWQSVSQFVGRITDHSNDVSQRMRWQYLAISADCQVSHITLADTTQSTRLPFTLLVRLHIGLQRDPLPPHWFWSTTNIHWSPLQRTRLHFHHIRYHWSLFTTTLSTSTILVHTLVYIHAYANTTGWTWTIVNTKTDNCTWLFTHFPNSL